MPAAHQPTTTTLSLFPGLTALSESRLHFPASSLLQKTRERQTSQRTCLLEMEKEKAGGQSRFRRKGHIERAPGLPQYIALLGSGHCDFPCP
jgi:hypothetical protein